MTCLIGGLLKTTKMGRFFLYPKFPWLLLPLPRKKNTNPIRNILQEVQKTKPQTCYPSNSLERMGSLHGEGKGCLFYRIIPPDLHGCQELSLLHSGRSTDYFHCVVNMFNTLLYHLLNLLSWVTANHSLETTL